MIDTYLDILRLDSGYHVPRQELIDIKRMLAEVIQVLRPWADSINIRIECELLPSLPPLRGDEDLLTGAMLNLLSNGIKYSPEMSVVRIRVMPRTAALAFEVWNSGAPISEQQCQSVENCCIAGLLGSQSWPDFRAVQL